MAREAHEQARQATTQYDVLSRSWKSLEASFRRQIQKLRGDVKGMEEEMTKEKQKVSRQQVLTEQTRQEVAKAKEINKQLQETFEAYKTEQERCLAEIKERAQRNGTANEEVLKEIEDVLGKMRWVINVKRDVKDAE